MDETEIRDSVTIEMADLCVDEQTEKGSDPIEQDERLSSNNNIDEKKTSDARDENQTQGVALSDEEKDVFKAVAGGDLAELKRLAGVLGDKLPVKNEEGNSLIHYAVKAGRIDLVAFLLEKQADFNSSTNAGGTAPLQLAAFSGFNEIVEMLLHHGADINHQDTSGNTALHFACQFNQPTTAMLLITFGAKLDIVNSIGDIPLHGACRNGLVHIVTKMCEFGCPINSANGQGDTPLHLASKKGSSEAVRSLMLHGVNLEAVDKDGKTAENVATDPEVLKLFAQYNLSMQYASQNKKFEMRKQLASSDKPLSRMKLAVLGHSGVGKTTFVESLKCGFLKSFLWSSYYTFSKATKVPTNQSANKSPSSYTKGVVLHNANLSDLGDVTIYDYSGCESYRSQYSLFLGDSSTIHVIVVSMNDPEETRSRQLHFWLEFIRIRMMPKEPIGFAGCNMWAPNVFIVMTNADESNSTKDQRGMWALRDEDKLLIPLMEKFEVDIILNRPVYVLDAQLPNSNEMKEFKKTLSKLKAYMQNFLPTQMGCLEQTCLELPAYRTALTSFPVVDFKTFSDFIRGRVNILASDDVIRELTGQLQLMGEIICYGTNPNEVLVLSPAWLGTEVIGKLFSPDTIEQYKTWTGFVSETYLMQLFQKFDFVKIMNLLKALNLCFERAQGDQTSSKEYYIHSYNRLDFHKDCKDWPECRKPAAIRSSVRLTSEDPMSHQFGHIFAHVINALRVVFIDKKGQFSQWKDACRVMEDGKVAVVTLDDDHGTVTVMCHSSDGDGTKLFSLSETICAVVYNAIEEQCPGVCLRRMPASWIDCLDCVHPPRFYEPSTILFAQMVALNSDVRLDEMSKPERLVDVLAFGSEEAFKKFVVSTEAHASCVSYLGRCRLAWLLDKDLETCKKLARILKVDEQMVPIESGSVSILDRMFSYWITDASITLRRLHDALKECGADEAAKVLLDVAPVFVYLPDVTVIEEN